MKRRDTHRREAASRLYRILMNAAITLSLVLCIATIALWACSQSRVQFVQWSDSYQYWNFESANGVLRCQCIRAASPQTKIDWVFLSLPPPEFDVGHGMPTPPLSRRLGFACAVEDFLQGDSRMRSYSASSPHWFTAALLAILPFLATRNIVRRRRATRQGTQNRCRSCGYDLSATPNRCPECGRLAPTPPLDTQPTQSHN
jgi:hypothetical protein